MEFSNNKKLAVVNLFAGPGCGKSTVAASLFAELKKNNTLVELVFEFAKDMVYDERHNIFGEQDYIFANQHQRLRRLLLHKIDVAITDSPLLLSLVYASEWYPKSFNSFVLDVFNSYNNLNIFLKRNDLHEWQQVGRNETFDTAKWLDQEILDVLDNNKINYHVVINDNDAVDSILQLLHQHLTK